MILTVRPFKDKDLYKLKVCEYILVHYTNYYVSSLALAYSRLTVPVRKLKRINLYAVSKT
jgi:hypothetical protein